jgi:anti-sigma B factor antagonist
MAIVRPLQVDAREEDGRVSLTLVGELDIATLPQLRDAIQTALAARPRRLVIDLRSLGFLDSSGLREFIVLADRAHEEGFELALVRPVKAVLAIFQITRAEENLPFVDEPPQ